MLLEAANERGKKNVAVIGKQTIATFSKCLAVTIGITYSTPVAIIAYVALRAIRKPLRQTVTKHTVFETMAGKGSMIVERARIAWRRLQGYPIPS